MLKVKILLETDELITARNAAKELKLHFTTVYRWMRARKLLVIPIGGVEYLLTGEVTALKNKTNEAQVENP